MGVLIYGCVQYEWMFVYMAAYSTSRCLCVWLCTRGDCVYGCVQYDSMFVCIVVYMFMAVYSRVGVCVYGSTIGARVRLCTIRVYVLVLMFVSVCTVLVGVRTSV